MTTLCEKNCKEDCVKRVGSMVNRATTFPSLDSYFEFKNLKPSTVANYKRSFDTIRNVLNYDKKDIGFLNQLKTFQRNIKKFNYSLNTLKGLYIAWYSLVQVFPEYCMRSKFQELKKTMDTYNTKSTENMAKNDVIQDKMSIADMREMISKMPNEDYDDYLNKLIVALYVYQPPVRLDFVNMRVYAKEKENVKDKENYCIFNKTGFYFVLNDFKTQKTIGRFVSQKVLPNTPLYHYLKFWFENFNTKKKYLLATYNGEESISRKSLADKLKNAFKRYADRKIGIQQIRRIYETELISSPEYAKMTLAEQKDKHRQLLHSFEMGHSYKVVDREDIDE